MPLKERFSENLRLLCSSEPSYAHVAREIGVNRQQFNDYINGRSLPNETIIKNLLKYFEIDVEILFKNSEKTEVEKLTSIFKKNSYRNVKDGFYFVYYLFNENQNFTNHKILRSLICIENRDNITTFKRITKANAFRRASEFTPVGKHLGVVLNIKDNIVFFGLNTVGYNEPSILVAQSILSTDIEFCGIAFTMLNGYHTTKFAIKRTPEDTPLRSLINKIGIVNETNNEDVQAIRNYLNTF